jgi:cephalosporin hydroxylase
MFKRDELEADKRRTALEQNSDAKLLKTAREFIVDSDRHGYGYQWTWLGLPFIQMPQDMAVTQEIIWETKPDVIVETGIAWGGSVLFSASLLHLIGKGEVIAVDLNLYDHVREQIMSYPFSNRIHLYKGSSTDPAIVAEIKSHVKSGQKVMVMLDSNHSHQHVLDELRLYAPLITKGQYLVVSDTIVEDIPRQEHRPRPWGPGNNPKTALRQYMKETDRFELDQYINDKLLLTYTPDGYCRCIKDSSAP